VNDLDAVKRVAGMPDVALILLKPCIKGIEIDDDVRAQCVIRRLERRSAPLGASYEQIERRSGRGMHGKRNAGVIDRPFPELRGRQHPTPAPRPAPPEQGS